MVVVLPAFMGSPSGYSIYRQRVRWARLVHSKQSPASQAGARLAAARARHYRALRAR